ncbi:uncharacterized protein ACRADG_007406 [Cochliomyia hominivorax]
MKTIFALFALSLVAVNAGTIPQPPINYEGMVNDILAEVKQIAREAAITLQHQIEEIVLDPLQQVEAAVESIEVLREENDRCVAAEDEKVAATVDGMHKEMAACGAVAARSSAEIMTDISAATQQLVFDGYDVVRTYQKCQKYTNSVLKNSCYARLTVKATLYMKNARKSIKTIQKSTNERIPTVVADANVCTHDAANIAVQELDNIHATINTCISET